MLPALAGLVLTGLALAAPSPAAAPADETTPLELSIESLSPSYVPERGPLHITGTVRNVSEEEWYDVNVLPFVGSQPIGSVAELQEAMETPATAEVGTRIAEVGNFDPVGDLAPGETVRFTVRLQHRYVENLTEPGAYWFGVHASGATLTQPRDGIADGRARTFLSQAAPETRSRLALVVPVRRQVDYDTDGRVADPGGWLADLTGQGDLADVLGLGSAAGSHRVTYLIDPAVTDAAQALADGNPARDLGPTEPADGDTGEGGDGESTDGAAAGESAAAGGTAADTQLAGVAQSWLRSLVSVLAGKQRLRLPYGDLDVAAALRTSPSRYGAAQRRSRLSLEALDLDSTPAVAPLSGYLPADALTELPHRTRLVVGERALAGSSRTKVADRTVFVAADSAIEGGPGPTAPDTEVALRQRLLAEAAVRAVEGDPGLVAVLSSDDLPEVGQAFFDGLETPWLRLADLADLKVAEETDQELDYPRAEQARELPAAGFTAAADLERTGRVLDDILPLADDIAAPVQRQALATLSQWHRDSPDEARLAALDSTTGMDALLGRIRVTGQPVQLSSESGRFSVTVINDLPQPVEVGLRATTDPQVRITAPEPVRLQGHSQLTRVLVAETDLLGVHQVELTAIDSRGREVGTSSTMTLRASRVSNVIWLVIGAGLLLMSVAIVRRLVLRINRWRRARGGTP